MKKAILLIALVALLLAAVVVEGHRHHKVHHKRLHKGRHPMKFPTDDESLKGLFTRFMHRHKKAYGTQAEFDNRFKIFKSNLKIIEQLRSAEPEARFGITKFADLSPAEFKSMYLNYKRPNVAVPEEKFLRLDHLDLANVPTDFDWREKGAVTSVKNQGQCGSCWAFSVTENIESMWILAGKGTNESVKLAPQQIVDCDTVDDGCNGGDPPTAYEYVMKAGGLESEQDYPYTAEDGQCAFDKSKVVASISDWKMVAQNGTNEKIMPAALVSIGPLSICVDAASWQFYFGGIRRSMCGTELDHCVQLVGYNQSGSTPYWIIRNSWGADWGEDGYIYVEMGKNLCGVAEEVTTSII
eukprot:GEZU01038903.1.p1 GENE.GEZU01038903.1~~GEZU01038903.1.p1  ORF type:complete len:354 (+),score=142.75 GEZU01038903.1:47-1108(+)